MLSRLFKKWVGLAPKYVRSYSERQTWGGRPYIRLRQAPRRVSQQLESVLLTYMRDENLEGVKRVVKTVMSRNIFTENAELANLVIEFYAKNKCPEEAKNVFISLQKPSIFAWHFMLKAYILVDEVDKARKLYDRMPYIVSHTRNMMIGAYLEQGRLRNAKALYDKKYQPKDGEYAPPDMVTWSIVFAALVKHDELSLARGMLDNMPKRIDVAWNTVVQAYCKKGCLDEAREAFDAMPEKNTITYRIMVSAYARRGHMSEARKLLNEMGEMDSMLWNEMIQGYARTGHLHEAYDMMEKLRLRTSIGSLTAMIQALGRVGKVHKAEAIFRSLLSPDMVALNSMLTVYARNGHIEQAKAIFLRMEDRNIVTWSNMIQGCAQHGYIIEAKKFFDESPYECVVASTALVGAYTRAGHMDEAKLLFESLNIRNVVTWTVMIGGYAQNGHPREALHFFRRMDQEGIFPDSFSFASVLTACRHVGHLNDGRMYFRYMEQDYGVAPRMEHYHCMIDILGQAAELERAEELINTMPFIPDATAWTSFIASCKTHGDAVRLKRATKHVVSPRGGTVFSSPYVLLSNLHATPYIDETPSDAMPDDYAEPISFN